MKKLLITLSILLLATTAHAERWIKCTDTTIGTVTFEKPSRHEGDCLALGFCTGLNNTGLATNVFEAVGSEWNDAGQSNKKCDRAAPDGSRIIDLTAQEIQDIADALANQADSQLRTSAKGQYDGQTTTALALRCFAKAVIDENNRDSQDVVDIMDCIDNANNLGTVKSCVGALPDLPQRTYQDAVTSVKNCIDAGETDE